MIERQGYCLSFTNIQLVDGYNYIKKILRPQSCLPRKGETSFKINFPGLAPYHPGFAHCLILDRGISKLKNPFLNTVDEFCDKS